MSAPIDYLNPPPLPKTALTPGSTPHDVDGVVEILRLITDPAVHEKQLAEQQQIKAAWAEIARERLELRRAKLAQEEELARLRQEFDRQLEVDRANHVAKTQEQERALAAKCEQFAALLNNAPTWVTDAD